MKFRGIFILPFFSLFFLSFSEYNSLKHFELRGKVKQLIAVSFLNWGAAGETPNYILTDSSVRNFNEGGKLISAFYYNRTEEKNTEFYMYDGDGHIKSHTISYPDSLHSDSIFYTYKNGVVAEIYSVSIRGGHSFKSGKTIFYYEREQLIAKREFDSRDDTLSEELYTYNEQGKLVSEIDKSAGVDKKKVSLLRTYEYDSARVLTGWRVDGFHTNALNTFWYNEQHDIVRSAHYSDTSSTVDYGYSEYEYDSTGNWIKKTYSTSTSDGRFKKRIQSLYTRSLTYY
jgi:hypothetical protein